MAGPLVTLVVAACFVQGMLAASRVPPQAKVAGGSLRGSWKLTRQGRDIAAFEGIPYAKPPVGEWRFMAPAPAEKWNGVRSALAPGPICPQRSFSNRSQVAGDEDCLLMNVYTPKGVSHSPLLDVMVWVHGGFFTTFSGSDYGPEFLLDEDVILVTFNYRLGLLGFLSTGDEVVPGNNGLKDQVQALRWVRENIASFGGNPNSVTVFGQSAGAASVHFLMMSPLAKGLFHRAIMQSATALSPWAVARPGEQQRNTQVLAKHLGCSTTSNKDFIQCLRTKSTSALVESDRLFAVGNFFMIPFKPTVESGSGAFIIQHPYDTLTTGSQASDVPYISGFNSAEGAAAIAGLFLNDTLRQQYSSNFNSLAAASLYLDAFQQPQVNLTLTEARQFYFGEGSLRREQVGKAVDMHSDAVFIWSVIEATRLHGKSSKSPVYMYELAYRSTKSFSQIFANSEENFGVCHGDEMLLLFPMESFFPGYKRSAADEAVSKSFVKYFTDFARTGLPTGNNSWSLVQHPESAEYLLVGSPGNATMRSNFSPSRMKFWSDAPIRLGRPASSR